MSRSSRSIRAYRWTNRALAVGVVVYVALAVGREFTAGQEEIFPFASWSLFSTVPNHSHDYSLRILSVGGHEIDRKPFFEDSRALFRNATDHSARMSIEHLCKAVERHDAAEVAKVRAYLEPLHLSGRGSVRYELVRRTYDPLERWHDRHAFLAVRPIAHFQSGVEQ